MMKPIPLHLENSVRYQKKKNIINKETNVKLTLNNRYNTLKPPEQYDKNEQEDRNLYLYLSTRDEENVHRCGRRGTIHYKMYNRLFD